MADFFSFFLLGQVREHHWSIRAYCVAALASQRGEPRAVQRCVARKVSALTATFAWSVCSGLLQGICRLCRGLGRAALFRVQLPRLMLIIPLCLPLQVLFHRPLKHP